MIKLTRRQLAKYAVDELAAKRPTAEIASHLAAVLVMQKRKSEAELLVADIGQELEARGLLAQVRVTSAHLLSAEQLAKLGLQLRKKLAVDGVELSGRIDKKVLGGVLIESANRRWDLTIKKQLNTIRESL
jgi:F0F1-type ATP synthase delta subunit